MNPLTLAALALMVMGCTKQVTAPDPPPATVEQGITKAAGINLMPGGGGTGTPDWDGRSQSWTIVWGKGGTERGNIYWSGNCMTVTSKTAYAQFLLTSPPAQVTKPWHTLTLKYLADTPVKLAVQYSDNCTYVVTTLPAVCKPTSVTIKFWAPQVRSLRLYNNINYGGTLRIDEVNLYDL